MRLEKKDEEIMVDTDEILKEDLGSEKPDEEDREIGEKSENNEGWRRYNDAFLPIVLPFIIIVDMAWLPYATNWGAPLLVGVLQTLFLVIYFPSVDIVFRRLTVAFGRNRT